MLTSFNSHTARGSSTGYLTNIQNLIDVSIPILRVGVQPWVEYELQPVQKVSIPILRVGVQPGLGTEFGSTMQVSIPILRVGVQLILSPAILLLTGFNSHTARRSSTK